MKDGTSRHETASLIIARGVAQSLKPLIWASLIYGCTREVSSALKEFAGRTSYADLHFVEQLFASRYLSASVTAAVTLSGWGFGILQRKLLQRTIKRLQTRIIDLERMIDSRRTSSLLEPDGKTRREDR